MNTQPCHDHHAFHFVSSDVPSTPTHPHPRAQAWLEERSQALRAQQQLLNKRLQEVARREAHLLELEQELELLTAGAGREQGHGGESPRSLTPKPQARRQQEQRQGDQSPSSVNPEPQASQQRQRNMSGTSAVDAVPLVADRPGRGTFQPLEEPAESDVKLNLETGEEELTATSTSPYFHPPAVGKEAATPSSSPPLPPASSPPLPPASSPPASSPPLPPASAPTCCLESPTSSRFVSPAGSVVDDRNLEGRSLATPAGVVSVCSVGGEWTVEVDEMGFRAQLGGGHP